MELPYLYLTATSNKEKQKAVKKKIRLKHHISRTEKCCESEDRSEWFAGFLKEELTSNQLKIPIMNWLFESEPVCRLCNL